MTRQLEQDAEDRVERENRAILQAVHGGLDEAVHTQGGILLGFSVRLSGGDCLLTLRAEFDGEAMVAFVGSESLAVGLRKSVKQAHTRELNWQEDRYA